MIKVAQSQAGRVTAVSFSLGKIQFRSRTPDQRRTLDFSEIEFVQLCDSIAKGRRIAVQFIGSDLLEGQTPLLNRSLHQFQSDFWLRLRFLPHRDTTCGTFVCIFVIQPGIRRDQLPFDQAKTLATGITQVDPHLAVSNIPNRTAVLLPSKPCTRPSPAPSPPRSLAIIALKQSFPPCPCRLIHLILYEANPVARDEIGRLFFRKIYRQPPPGLLKPHRAVIPQYPYRSHNRSIL